MFVPFVSANGALVRERGLRPQRQEALQRADSTIWRDLRLICDRADDSDVARLLAATRAAGSSSAASRLQSIESEEALTENRHRVVSVGEHYGAGGACLFALA